MIKVLGSIGNAYYAQSEYVSALEYYQKVRSIAEKIADKKIMARNIGNIGAIYLQQGNYPFALEYNLKSLKLEEELGNQEGVATSLQNIGVIHHYQNNYPLALEYTQKALHIREKLQDKYAIIESLENMGLAYQANGNYPLGLECYEKSLRMAREVHDKKSESYTLNNIADVLQKQGNKAKALEYYAQSLKIKRELGDKWAMIYSLNGLAKAHIAQKEYEKAMIYAQEGLAIAQEIKALREISFMNKTLFEVYKLKGDATKALEYHELFKQTNDSIFNIESSKKLVNLEAQADIDRKQQEIKLLNKNQEILAKDNLLQKTERLAIEKQKEANELNALARQEKDKRKQDSLYNLAQQKQLEADKFLAQNKTEKLKTLQQKEAKEAQQRLLYVVSGALLVALMLAYLAYRSRQAEKRAKNEISAQKEEITTQAEQLEIANKTKDQLFSIVAHDLRSPMMAFQGLNQQIKFFLRKNRPEKLEALGENIEKASTRLNMLLDNLLQWAMLQKQVITVNPQPIDLQEATTHCLAYYEGLAQSQQVTLHQAVGKESITTDYNMLQTILRNLLSNALKFTPEGGHIYLAYQREGRQGTLSVRDTGAGMSAEKVATLFQGIQFKSEQGLRGEKGTGIGLQLCYELAQQINATLCVESQEGQGTTFSLTFSN